MPSLSSPYSSQTRRNYLFHRLSQSVILALFIYGVTAASSGEGEPTNTSVAEPSQTLDNLFSEAHSILASVTTEPVAAPNAIVDDHDVQAHFKVSSDEGEIPNYSSVLLPEEAVEPEINESLVNLRENPDDTIEVDGDACPDGYEEVVEEEGVEVPILQEEEKTETEANTEATGTGAFIEKNATDHPPVAGDVPIDPLDHSFIETVQEVIAESNISEDKEVLEDFLAELFQEPASEPLDEPAQPSLAPNPQVLTEEEIAERKRLLEIETREKRADITGRHAEWEARLEERGKEVLAELLKQVNELRAHVSNDVRNNEEISKLFSGYESEANKAIKGVEAFFEKRIKIGKEIEKSVVKTWEEILRKVEKKIDDKKREVEKEMQEYYSSYVEEELEHVEQAIKRIEKVADDAQADLGMDYAWLDDVTVNDWTRYHDLMRTAKRWGDIYRSVFNSTHPDLSSNEVVFALEDFQAILRDIGFGFDHVLGNLERKAERIFKGEHDVEDIPGLGEEGVVTPQGEAAEKVAQEGEEVPVLGLGGGPAHLAAPVIQHAEL